METEGAVLGAIAIFAAIMLAAFLPAILRIAILPAVVLEILFGVAIGPQGLGLAEIVQPLGTLSQLGLAILFLIAGLEIDPVEVSGAPTRLAIRGWFASIGIALGLAFAGYLIGWLPAPGLIAIAVATTAIGALMPILKDTGILESSYGPYVLAAGAFGEALPLVALSLVLAGVAGLGAQSVVLVGFALVASAVILLAGHLRSSNLPPFLRRTMTGSSQFPIRLALFLTISFALIGESLGLDLVLGAFAAGAVLRALLPGDVRHALMERLSAVGYGFLIPIFFVTSGMELDIASLAEAPSAMIAVPAFVLMMLLARGLPALLLYRDVLSSRERVALALHSSTQLPLVVAVSALGVQSGVMPGWCAAALVVAALVTVILFPALAHWVLKRRQADEFGDL